MPDDGNITNKVNGLPIMESWNPKACEGKKRNRT
jgi:hypothetical protein